MAGCGADAPMLPISMPSATSASAVSASKRASNAGRNRAYQHDGLLTLPMLQPA